MSGGGGSTKSIQQNYSPEEAAKRAQVMTEAQRVYNLTKGGYASGGYPGAEVVPFDYWTLAGQNALLQGAAGAGQNAQAASAGVNYGLSGAMDVNNNPYLQQSVDAALQRVQQQWTDPNGVMSQIRTGAQNAGQFGGSRQGVAEGVAARGLAQSLGDTAATMYSDAYNKGQETFAKTLALTPNIMQSYALPAQWLSAVGAQNENQAQALENYNAAARQWNIDAPWIPLENYANIVYGGGSSQTGTKTDGPAKNPLLGAVGGAAAGWAAGASIGSSAGPYGAAIGAIIGALM